MRKLPYAALHIGCVAIAGFIAASARAEPPIAGMRLTFADEFNSLSIAYDRKGTWRPELGSGGPGSLDSRTFRSSQQKQIFMDTDFRGTGDKPLGVNPFAVRDGVLSITADRAPEAVRPHIWGYPYTGGVLTTKFSFAQKYGYFEMRAKLPRGRGFWPAFWLMPLDNSRTPEIDIMEMLGHEPNVIYNTLFKLTNGKVGYEQKKIRVADVSASFNVYGLLWTPEKLTWYFNGKETWSAPVPSEGHKPMYIIMNLSVGGSWPKDPDNSTTLPATMDVDYVRVYRDERN